MGDLQSHSSFWTVPWPPGSLTTLSLPIPASPLLLACEQVLDLGFGKWPHLEAREVSQSAKKAAWSQGRSGWAWEGGTEGCRRGTQALWGHGVGHLRLAGVGEEQETLAKSGGLAKPKFRNVYSFREHFCLSEDVPRRDTVSGRPRVASLSRLGGQSQREGSWVET